ncbi:MAG: CBS domain-containing protein [Desulfurococcales archaeon]|nr:CBS domain-containing protein [Desulfurococcales archaeon]
MLRDRVWLYSTKPVIRAPLEARLVEIMELMARHGIRRVMILDGVRPSFISIDTIIRVLASTDYRKIETLEAVYLPLEVPPILHESMSVIEAVLLLMGSKRDYGIVLNNEESILTVRDVLKAVEKHDIELPVISCSLRRYPAIRTTASIHEAVKLMARYNVRALLVADPGGSTYRVYGYLDSRKIIDFIAKMGSEALMLRVDQLYEPIKSRVEPGDTMSRAAKILAYTNAPLGVITVGDYIVGVVDEMGILESITCTITKCSRCEYMMYERRADLLEEKRTMLQYTKTPLSHLTA